MRYWALLAAKLVVAAVPMYALLAVISGLFPQRPEYASDFWPLETGGQALACNLALMAWVLACARLFYLIRWNQRHRCRVCLRRLRMPVETGSWSRMLQLGRPRIEYICPYGHGTLKEEELQISGLANPEWTPQSEDLWEELCASIDKDDDKQT